MADVKWIKITTDMFDNRKIKHLRKLPDGNNIVLIWVMLLTMAGRCNSGGMIFLTENIPYTPKMLADELGFEENTVQLALQALEQFNMIVTNQGYFSIAGWNEYQNIDGMDKIREQTRKRVAAHRAKQKQLTDGVTSNATVTQGNATEEEREEETEEERELDKKKRGKTPSPKSKKAKPFTPPTLEEIEAYCRERNNNVDAKRFFDYFSASDWVDSKGNKVKNWKQKVITWEGYANESKSAGRKEIVPDWMKNNRAKEDMERAKRLLAEMEKPTAGNSPDVAAKAEDLKKRLGV